MEEQALAPKEKNDGHVSFKFRLSRHLGTLDGYWRVLGGGPQCARVRDRGAGGDTEVRTFSHEWTAGCEGAEVEQGERLGKAARGVGQA